MSKRILVVDDSFLARDLLTYMVAAGGYEVEAAADGAEALERLVTSSFDLALVDLNMPKMDGYTLLRRVRETAGIDEMALVIVTTEAEARDKTRAVDAGADLYMVKPVQPEELLANIRMLIGGADG